MPKRSLFLSLFFIPIILLGIALGIWQYQRSVWKEELLTEYHKKLSEKPTLLPTLVIRLKGEKSSITGKNSELFKEFELMPIILTGVFLPKVIYYRPSGNGLELITAFKTSNGIIAINAGIMPYSAKEIALDKILPTNEITITGFYRIAEPYGGKIPDNKSLVAKIPYGAFFKHYKEQALAGAIQIDDKTIISDYLKGRSTDHFIKNIPNNHIQYMGTWFLLTGIAIIVYMILLRRV